MINYDLPEDAGVQEPRRPHWARRRDRRRVTFVGEWDLTNSTPRSKAGSRPPRVLELYAGTWRTEVLRRREGRASRGTRDRVVASSTTAGLPGSSRRPVRHNATSRLPEARSRAVLLERRLRSSSARRWRRRRVRSGQHAHQPDVRRAVRGPAAEGRRPFSRARHVDAATSRQVKLSGSQRSGGCALAS